MSIAPEAPGGVPMSALTTEALEAEAVVLLDQARLGALYHRIKDSLPMVLDAAAGDMSDDGSFRGNGDLITQEGRIVTALDTFHHPFARPAGTGPWRRLGTLIERITIDHELGEELTRREFGLLWDGANAFDLVRYQADVPSGATPDDLERLHGYFR